MVAGSVVCDAVVLAVGWTPVLPAHLVLAVISVPLAAADWTVQRLPSSIVLPATAVTFTLFVAAAAIEQAPGQLGQAMLAAAALVALFMALGLLGELGGGDVRLAALLGLDLGWHGWETVLVGTLLGFAAAAVVTGALLVAGRASWRSRLALGPHLLLGAIVAVVLA